MKSLNLLMSGVAIASLATLSGLTIVMGQETFAIGDPGIKETAKGHGEDVTREAIGDPNQVPGEAMGHGEDVSDVASGIR